MNNFFWSHNNKLHLGQWHRGGLIFYFLQSGDSGYDASVQHGLITTTSDQSASMVWDPDPWAYINTSQAIGYGKQNTDYAVTAIGSGTYAAKYCSDLLLNGYDDWYLPTTNEMLKMFDAKSIIQLPESVVYWSSHNVSAYYAKSFTYTGNTASFTDRDKTVTCRVRAIRSF